MVIECAMDTYEARRQALKAIIDRQFGGSIARLAEFVDIKPPQISRWLSVTTKDPRKITENSARALEEKLGLPEKYLDQVDQVDITIIEPDGRYTVTEFKREPYTANPNHRQPMRENHQKYAEIPLLNAAGSMGAGETMPENEIITDSLRLSMDWLKGQFTGIKSISSLAFIHAIGDSMAPTFNDGDILLVDTGNIEATADKIYVLEAHNRLFIKRVRQRLDGKYEISSDNPAIKTIDILNGDHEVTIKGRVVWAWNGKRL